MTCVVASGWHPFHDSNPWSPMNPDDSPQYSLERQQSHGYTSSGSESRRAGGGSLKKRASRAGTRSVSTLSAAQLERKRANDREAQRAIRQRTKDHIENLEKSIGELRGSQEASEKLAAATQHRNRELEEENAYLRTKLAEAGYPVPPSESHRPSDAPVVSIHATSPATQASASGSSIPRPSTSSPRSLSLVPSHSSSRHSSFQQPASLLPTIPSSNLSVAPTGMPAGSQNVAGWRPHDAGQSMQSAISMPLQAPVQHQQSMSYPNSGPRQGEQRADWNSPAGQHYQYPSHEQQPIKYEPQPPSHPPPQPHAYVQASVPSYPAPPPGPTAYQAPQMPPQAEFQNMAVSSPANYPVPPQQQVPPTHGYQTQPQQTYPPTYSAQPGYQVTPMAVSQPHSNYTAAHGGQVPPPSLPSSTYQPAQHEQYSAPSQQSQLPYRDEGSNRAYAMTHYS